MCLRRVALRFVTLAVLSTVVFTAGPASAQIRITEVMSSSPNSGDWFELTNISSSAVDLANWYWDDNGPSGADGAVFPQMVVNPGESVVVVSGVVDQAGTDAFVANWGGGFTAYGEYLFGGPDTFSGLSSNGDQIELWDADPNTAATFALIDSVTFGAATAGSSFAWSTDGTDLGVSINGVNLAVTSTLGDIGSPGAAVSPVPEPSSIVLAAFAGLGLAGYAVRRRRARSATPAAA